MKRFHKGYAFYHLITDFFGALLVALIFADVIILEDEAGEYIGINYSVIPYFIIVIALVYLLFVVYRVLYLRKSGYTLTETEIRCKRGVLFRRNSILEYKNVHAINIRRNILHMMFGISVLTVDSGSANTANSAEIVIIEKHEKAEELMKKIKALAAGKKADTDAACQADEKERVISGSLYNFTSKKKMLYTFVNIITSAFVMFVIGFIGSVVFTVLSAILKVSWLSGIGEAVVKALIATLVLILIASVIAFIGCIINSFVGFYNFKAVRQGEDVEISYGLIVRHKNVFNKDRIKAVRVRQGLVSRALGFAKIELEVIGYGETSGDDESSLGVGILVPFCSYNEVGEIINRLFPEYVPQEKEKKAKALFPFFSWKYLLFSIVYLFVFASVMIYLSVFDASSVVFAAVGIVFSCVFITALLFIFISSVLQNKTDGITVGDEKITVYSGGFFKKITVFQNAAIVAVEEISTPMRRKAGISSYILHLRTNAQTNEVRVNIQDELLFSLLENSIKY